MKRLLALGLCVGVLAAAGDAPAEYAKTTPKPLPADAVAVTGPGNYDKPGTTYVLTADVRSPTSAVFLGKDVTLDLNGHTIEYASANYTHVPNCGFEEGLTHWDVSKAPGAKIILTEETRPFIGAKMLHLPEGQEIVSPYVELPVADRSYYAMCGVTDQKMAVEVSVEDAAGKPVHCEFKWGDRVRVSCPQKGSPKLGGGFVFAHIHHLGAGRYRIRVKAIRKDCQIDEVDIRPALDVGVAVIDKTYPWAYYKCIYDGDYTAFFDYTKPGSYSDPVETVPRVTGDGTVTIRNGVIKSGVKGIRSWGLQSTAEGVTLRLENVKFVASGINTNAVDVPQALIKDCRFEIDTPFIIDRHRLQDMVVNLKGPGASEVSHSEIIGGQGGICCRASGCKIHDNLFVNRQTVTNHYSIAATGEGIRITDNRFEPEIGSGIELFGAKNCEIRGNTFNITAAPPNCEYRYSDYSTNAIRITDYNRAPGAPGACGENTITGNTFHIVGKDYPQYARYIPMAYGIFMSVGGGRTYVTNNTFTVDYQGSGKDGIARAIYVGGSNNGGEYTGNTITTNVPAFWFASRYGEAANILAKNNTIVRAPNAKGDFAPFEFGWWRHEAKDVELRSNDFKGLDFDVQFSNTKDNRHTYKVYWTLTVKTTPAAEVVVTDKSGREVLRKNADANGELKAELLEFSAVGKDRTYSAPCKVTAAGVEKTVELKKNTTVTIRP
ncbi:MAG TPA: right-handed parallel beta-helix repeat-containing protein [Planctomycetota bacterium]|nr:right-handed parallel beta-helix repeat-containing protein [Planctomycetota bacterium]